MLLHYRTTDAVLRKGEGFNNTCLLQPYMHFHRFVVLLAETAE
jgi:hypothetical protein